MKQGTLAAGRWISVNDHLPEFGEDEKVLLCKRGGDVYLGYRIRCLSESGAPLEQWFWITDGEGREIENVKYWARIYLPGKDPE